MDFITEVEKTVVIKESMPCAACVLDRGDYLTVQINGWSVFNIHPDGTFSRVGAVPRCSGVKVDEYSQIIERERE